MAQHPPPPRPPRPDLARAVEVRARQAIEQERREFLDQFFAGASVVTKPLVALRNIQNVANQVRDVAAAGRVVAQTAVQPAVDSARAALQREAVDLLCALFQVDPSLIYEIAAELGNHVLVEVLQVLGKVAPLIGSTASGVSALRSWTNVALAAWRLRKGIVGSRGMLEGDPAAAAAALRRILQREFTQNALASARVTAQAAVQITADGLTLAEIGVAPVTFGGTAVFAGPTALIGPVASLTSAALGLVHTLFLMGRDFHEKRQANKILHSDEPLDAGVFDVCPLLGCYMLLCAEHSTLLGFGVDEIGRPGWMERVEIQRKKYLQPLQVQASRVILAHRFRVAGFAHEADVGADHISKAHVIHGDGLRYDVRRFKAHVRRKAVRIALRPVKSVWNRLRGR